MTECRPVEPIVTEPIDSPSIHTSKLDTVWFQVAGTICNLRCHHCFISCSPDNRAFDFLTTETCARYLEEAKQLGVKEFYFTGGEPFANPQICYILELALQYGPATVLTNATLFRPGTLDHLDRIRRAATNPLELRVSLDGHTAAMNDPIRGEGTFDRAMEGVRQLVAHGFRPILTIARTWSCCEEGTALGGFRALLEGIGYDRPRLKVLPLLKIGAEVQRGGGYGQDARVTPAMMDGYDQSQLLCSNSRLVTDRGVWVCPILLDSPDARLGETLSETIRDYPLKHAACFTCWQNGPICTNELNGLQDATFTAGSPVRDGLSSRPS